MKIILLNELFRFPFLIFLFLFFCSIYSFVFKRIISKKIVPTGAGIIIPAFLAFSLENLNQKNSIIFSLIIIFINSIFYFIDDIKGLKPSLRILISMLTGFLLLYVHSNNFLDSNFNNYIFISYFFIICLTCLLVNVLNFYDGCDLNLCSIILISGIILLVSNNYPIEYGRYLGFVLVSFSLGFGILNARPKSIYLGDTGSFSIAALFIFIFISSLTESNYLPIEFISLLSLPIFDVLYVIAIRLIKKHDLLSRNYLHLYQRLQIRYKFFYYLIPTIFNFLICLNSFHILMYLFNSLYFSLFTICFLVTPIVYLSIRKIYLEPKYFFGDGSSN